VVQNGFETGMRFVSGAQERVPKVV
jgi:hypothetical protein